MGNLSETPLAPLLLSLARDQFEGWLTLERPGTLRRFRWKKGAPVQLASDRAEDTLAAFLAARGQLSAAQKASLTKKLAEKPGNELAALAALGIAPKELLLGLAGSLERALVDCLTWPNGQFAMAYEPAPGHAPTLPLSLPAIVYDAIAASWRADQTLVALGARATQIPTLGEDAAARVGAKLLQLPSARALLPLLDGVHSAFEAVREAHHPQAHAVLWLLDACGALVYGEARAGTARAPRGAGPEIEIVVAGGDARGQALAAAPMAAQAKKDPAREAAADALRREVTELHAKLAELDLWQLLGAARGASTGEIKRAYLGAAKRMHPDHLMRLGLHDLKEIANQVFTQIARAHEVLSDPDERARYEESTTGVSEAQALLAGQAEQLYQRGEMLMRAGNFRGAAEFLEKAVQTFDAEPEYHAAFAWALHRKTPPDNARALHHFERAVAEGQERAQVFLRMSLVLRELGDARAADLAVRAKALDANVKP